MKKTKAVKKFLVYVNGHVLLSGASLKQARAFANDVTDIMSHVFNLDFEALILPDGPKKRK